MVDMFIHAWTGSVKGREEKVSRDGGSLGIQGRTLYRSLIPSFAAPCPLCSALERKR
jgi:hypothetical protein